MSSPDQSTRVGIALDHPGHRFCPIRPRLPHPPHHQPGRTPRDPAASRLQGHLQRTAGPQLPPPGQRVAGQLDRWLDPAHRAGLAGAHDHRQRHRGRHHHRTAVPPHPPARPVRRCDRGPLPEAEGPALSPRPRWAWRPPILADPRVHRPGAGLAGVHDGPVPRPRHRGRQSDQAVLRHRTRRQGPGPERDQHGVVDVPAGQPDRPGARRRAARLDRHRLGVRAQRLHLLRLDQRPAADARERDARAARRPQGERRDADPGRAARRRAVRVPRARGPVGDRVGRHLRDVHASACR